MENGYATDKKRVIVITGLIALIVILFILNLKFAHAASTPLHANKQTGMLEKGVQEGKHPVTIVLVGATDYEVAEIFNDIIENTPGVVAANRRLFTFFPADPAKCRVEWQVVIEKTSLFDLESRIYRALQKVTKNDRDDLPKLTLKPTEAQRNLPARITPWQAASREICFRMLHLEKNNGSRNLQHDTGVFRRPDRGFE